MNGLWLSLVVASFLAFSDAQNFCRRYGLTGEQLMLAHGRLLLDDGSVWEQVIEGHLRFIRLNFNRVVELQKVALQMRVNPEIRVITYDEGGNLQARFFQVQAGRRIPLETTLPEQPAVRKLMLQGFDAQLTFDEISYINVTVCAHNCRSVPGCYGECKPIEKDFGCVECSCPEGSPSSGCSGIPEPAMTNLLDQAAKKTQKCAFTVGYKRVVKPQLGIDDCISFSYPKCDFFQDVIVPKSKVDCLKYCY